MILLDTSALIEWSVGSKKGAAIHSLCEDKEVGISAITLNEFLVGLENDHPLLQQITIYSFDEQTARVSAKLERNARKQGSPLPKIDALIAASAQVQNATLITLDKRFTDIKEIRTLLIE